MTLKFRASNMNGLITDLRHRRPGETCAGPFSLSLVWMFDSGAEQQARWR